MLQKKYFIACVLVAVFMALVFIYFENKTQVPEVINQTSNQYAYENYSGKDDLNDVIKYYKETLEEKGYCGDGMCNPKNNENRSTCCVDCGCEENFTCTGESCINMQKPLEKTSKCVPKILLPRTVEYPYQDMELRLIDVAKKDKRVQDILSRKDYFVIGSPLIGQSEESGEVWFEVENKAYKVKIEKKKVISINASNDSEYNNIPSFCNPLFSVESEEQKKALEAEGLLEEFLKRAEQERKKCIQRDLLYNLALNDSKVKKSINGKDFLIVREYKDYNISQNALNFKCVVGKRGFPGTFNKGYEVFVDGNSKTVRVQEITNKTEIYRLRGKVFMDFGNGIFYVYGDIKNQTNGMEKIFISLDDVG